MIDVRCFRINFREKYMDRRSTPKPIFDMHKIFSRLGFQHTLPSLTISDTSVGKTREILVHHSTLFPDSLRFYSFAQFSGHHQSP